MPETISSHSNPVIKQVRALRQKKEREESGLFLVEGIHHVGEAVEAGWELETLLYSPEQLTSDYGTGLVAAVEKKGGRCIALTANLFSELAEKENPQGILGIFHQRMLKFENVSTDPKKVYAALVTPQDPGNVGTILRTLDAVGGDGLFILDGGVELYHPSVIRASMGAIFWKPVVRASYDEFKSWVTQNGIRLVGSSAHAQADYREVKPDGRATILLLGSEQKGLSKRELADCETTVSIPMRGRASSLNLAVAASILLYTFRD